MGKRLERFEDWQEVGMESWKTNIENVIQKWEKNGPPAHIFEKRDFKGTQSIPPNSRENGDSRKTRRICKPGNRVKDRKKEQEYWTSLQLHQTPRKFKLAAPLIKPLRAPYQMHKCKQCQNNDVIFLKKESSQSNLFNVFNGNEYSRKKTFTSYFAPDFDFILSRKTYSYPKMIMLSQEMEPKSQEGPRLYVDEACEERERLPDSSSLETCEQNTKLLSSMSITLIRLVSWAVLKFFRRTLSSICCQREDVQVLQAATKKGIPLIYLPACKSLLDYVIVSFVLYCNNIRLPYTFISGQICNSRICRFLLRKLGIVFVEDDFKDEKDPRKSEIIENFVERLLREKRSMQIGLGDQKQRNFPNLIKKVTQCVSEGAIDDAYVVPISVTCETENKSTAVGLWSVLKYLCLGFKSDFNGMIHVRFGFPYSTKDFCSRAHKFTPQEGSSLECPLNASVNGTPVRPLVGVTDSLVDHIKADCNSFNVISCTSMLSFLLITKHKSGVSLEELVTSFEWLKQEILDSKRCIGFYGETLTVVNYALRLLGNQYLVEIKTDVELGTGPVTIVSAVENKDKISQLWENSEQIVLVFAVKSIVATALLGLSGGANISQIDQVLDCTVTREEVLLSSRELCRILKNEFNLFSPCTDIMTSLSDVLNDFVASGVLVLSEDDERRNQPKFAPLDWEDDDTSSARGHYEVDIRYELSRIEENRDFLLFLHSLVAPALEVIWFTAANLAENQEYQEVKEHYFIDSVHRKFVEKSSRGHSFGVGGYNAKRFHRIVDTLVDFGFLQRTQGNSQLCALKSSVKLSGDQRFIDFLQKLESHL